MRLAISAVLVSMALTASLAAQTATNTPPPAPEEQMHPGGPHGLHGPHGPGAFGRGMDRTVETIPNSPFIAQFTDTSSSTARGGKQEQRTSTSMVYRDSQGRVRQEITLPLPPPRPPASDTVGTPSAPPPVSRGPRTVVTILDPVAHTVTRLNPDRQTAHVQTVPAEFFTQMQAREDRRATSGQSGPMRGDATRKNLGGKVIAGVNAAGEQTVLTLSSHDGGAEHTITRELWFSPDAKFEVSSSETGDRGTRSHTLTTFSKTEPDPGLFQVPAGYTITNASNSHMGGHHRGGDNAPQGPSPTD